MSLGVTVSVIGSYCQCHWELLSVSLGVTVSVIGSYCTGRLARDLQTCFYVVCCDVYKDLFVVLFAVVYTKTCLLYYLLWCIQRGHHIN